MTAAQWMVVLSVVLAAAFVIVLFTDQSQVPISGR
jgi:hypothetical protein